MPELSFWRSWLGLPDSPLLGLEGIMGNREAGHEHLGVGRVIGQEIVRIDKAIANSKFESNAVLRHAAKNPHGMIPEMNAFVVKDEANSAILSRRYSLMIATLANEASHKAAETVDDWRNELYFVASILSMATR
jgi:bisphosphoglycerate-independent phosphoglycerate mutase (AlkP superfamily)